MKFSAPHADLFQSPRLQDAEGKRGHSGTQLSQIPPVEPDSERQSGTVGHTGEGVPGTSPDVSVADGSQAVANLGSTTFSVYRFYDAAGTLLYVGRTYRIENRLSDHRREKDWWRLITRIELDHFDSAEEMAVAEARQIIDLNPLYNIIRGVPVPVQVPREWAPNTPDRAKKNPEPYLRPEEVEEALGWTRPELDAAVEAGCPVCTIANSARFRWSDIQAWLEQREEAA